MNTYTKEQREAWNKINQGAGLYNAEGRGAYEYVLWLIKWLLLDKSDPHTVLLIGRNKHKAAFLQKMIEEGVINDVLVAEPEFKMYRDYDPEQPDRPLDEVDEEDHENRGCHSENDTEAFCNFILNADPKVNGYNKVAAVVLLEQEYSLKYVDKLLKIPKWRGSTLEKHIELPVYSVHDIDEPQSVFEKVKDAKTPSGLKQTLELIRGDQVKIEHIEMLVPGVVVKNAPNAFNGEMGEKKSTTATDIGAAGSCWRDWFTGEKNDTKPFITLYVGAEDSYSTTIVPRFIAAGGNPDCLYCVPLEVRCEQQTQDGLKEYYTQLNLDEHLELLADNIRKINSMREWQVGLLINDPIISLFGNKNYNNSQDARDIMTGLKKLCEELQVTVINICHFNKTLGLGAKQKTAGAKALIEAHRMAWAFDSHESGDNITLMAPIKHNLLKEALSYKLSTVSTEIEYPVGDGFYQTAEVGVVKFVGYSDKTADDRIEEKESKDRGSRKEIKKAILDLLKSGPMSAGQVCNELRDMGGIATLRRAAQSLEDEGKLRRVGNNNRNMTWDLATEAEQIPVFQGVATNE